MILSRLFIGVGEAAYGSVGLAVVLAVFPGYRRAAFTRAFLMWDLTDPQRPSRLGGPLVGGGLAPAAAFSRDGRSLAVGGNSRQVIVWDITERARPIEVGGPLPAGGPVSAVGFAPDGTLAAVVDGTEADAVEFWRFSSVEEVRAHPVDIACAVVEDALSPAEWAVYVSELGYRPTCSA